MNPHSPITGYPSQPVRKIDSAKIIDGYRTRYGVDVSEYFKGLPKVDVFRCQQTGYEFYYPHSLVGRERLYRDLERTHDGTYKEDKWEYQTALAALDPNSHVLDVGAGKGAFVALCNVNGHSAQGLELNSASASEAVAMGRSIVAETIEDHAAQHPVAYDAVCSFQVLEHIPDVKSFISSCLAAIKSDGKLIYAVPNNAGFVGRDDQAFLNMPPHHMGLWTPHSLSKLPDHFPMKLESICTEPLAEIDWYAALTEKKIPPTLRRVYFKLGAHLAYRKALSTLADRIHGHTVLAVYRKL